MRIPFSQIDAFATTAFTGNSAAVLSLAEWLPDAVMHEIAVQTGAPETAFFTISATPQVADFDIRWFGASGEVALCGHATLAAGHLILIAMPALSNLRFQTLQAGVLTVSRSADDTRAITLPVLPATRAPDATLAGRIAAALGGNPAEIWLRGDDYILAVFEHAPEIRQLRPDFKALTGLCAPKAMTIATALGLGDGSGAQVISRAFIPGAGTNEGQVTGSAHAVLTPYWAARMGRDSFTAFQASLRGGHLGCRVVGDTVVLTGHCRTVIQGEFLLP